MNRLAASIAIIGLSLPAGSALAYQATANVTFNWATNGLATGWTSSAPNSLANVSNSTYFTSLTGNNSTTYYNADFAKSTDATGWCAPGTESFQAQYACKVGTNTPLPTAGGGNLGPGAGASGTLTVTDTAMTGTLTVITTSDEGAGPQPGTTAATGYNVRSADGSPFKNVWYGISSTATLTVNLTGTFTATSWQITGGTVAIFDAGFQCGVADFSGVLCNTSTVSGGFRANGQGLSWGLDQGTGPATAVTQIEVRDAAGTSILSTLSGVLADLTVDAGSGAITTNQGEFRNGSGNNGQGCPTGTIRYGVVGAGNGITCGTLQVGLLSITGTATAAAEAPDAFTFTDQTGVALSTQVTSNTVTITGLTAPAAISVTGGEYSIGCTASFTSAAGTINNNDTVCVRQTSSATPGTTTNTALTVGGGGDTFSVTTVPADTTPNAFSFTDQTGVALSTVITSDTVTISGINAAAPISVTGGTYSIGCTGTFTGTAATITSGQTVCVRHTSAAAGSTNTDTVLTVGGVSDTFRSTTLVVDQDPDAFTFTPAINQPLSTAVTSNTVTIAGINAAAPISVAGGQYSIGCTGTFTGTAGTINDGQTVCVRQTSSATPATTTDTTLTIGTVDGVFSVTTVPVDTAPDAFSFTDVTGQTPGGVVTSNTVTIQGINAAAAISITGGSYSVGCTATFVTTAATITNGQTVCLRQTASSTPSTLTDAVLTVGGVSDTWSVTSAAVVPDTQPDIFLFDNPENVELSTLVTSNAVTITGINVPADVRISGPGNPEFSINGGAFQAASVVGSISAGQTLVIRHTSSATAGDAIQTTVTIGNPSPAPSSQRRVGQFTSLTAPAGDGGSSSADGLMIGLLGLVALLRRRRLSAS